MINSSEKNSTLALKAQNGDSEALEEIMQQTYEIAFLTNKKKYYQYADIVSPEDIAQDVSINILNYLQKQKYSKGSFNWFVQISAQREYMKNLKKEFKLYRINIDEINHTHLETKNEFYKANFKETIDQILETVQNKEMLEIAIDKFEGMSIYDAKEKYQLVEGTIKSRIHRVKQELKKYEVSLREALEDIM